MQRAKTTAIAALTDPADSPADPIPNGIVTTTVRDSKAARASLQLVFSGTNQGIGQKKDRGGRRGGEGLLRSRISLRRFLAATDV